MGICHYLNSLLTFLLLVILCFSTVFILFGLALLLFPSFLVERYIDPAAKGLKVTKFLINSHESLVPTKDDLPEELNLGFWLQQFAYAITFMGAALATFATLGIVASLTRKPCLLLTLTVLMTLGILGQFAIMVSLIDLTSDLHVQAQRQLVDILHVEYEVGAKTKSSFTFVMNSVMLMEECCGVIGPVDFLEMPLHFHYTLANVTESVRLRLPPACCKQKFIRQGFKATLGCAKNLMAYDINNKGCYYELYRTIGERYGDYVTWIFFGVITWEMVIVLIALLLLFRPSIEEKNAMKQALAPAQWKQDELDEKLVRSRFESEIGRTDSEPLGRSAYMNIFIPYAKESSAVKDKVRRICSTEIW